MPGQKKGAKVGRNRKKGHAVAYKAERRQEKSHVRRIKRHIKRYGSNDKVALDSMIRLAVQVGPNEVKKVEQFIESCK